MQSSNPTRGVCSLSSLSPRHGVSSPVCSPLLTMQLPFAPANMAGNTSEGYAGAALRPKQVSTYSRRRPAAPCAPQTACSQGVSPRSAFLLLSPSASADIPGLHVYIACARPGAQRARHGGVPSTVTSPPASLSLRSHVSCFKPQCGPLRLSLKSGLCGDGISNILAMLAPRGRPGGPHWGARVWRLALLPANRDGAEC